MNRLKKILLGIWIGILKARDYVRTDGLLHVMACYIIYDVTEAVFTWWVALILTCTAIAGKEAYDYLTRKGTAEMHDIHCGLAGLLISIIINLLP